MRFVMVLAAGLLWTGAAVAQVSSTPEVSGHEPTASQAQSPAASTDPNATTQIAGQATDRNHEVVCHTIMATGSRLARHATRICKTREQWDAEAEQNSRDMNTVQQRSQGFQGSGPAPGAGGPG
jgi:hypothetical protein